ncbi:hypothetical protein GGX14DRAFT_660571 [Mycena pura]|uniref:Uncharacterized protein n=1 Tax=Mycena pura TaxID=153505 RepID=A0AAD6V188_9AGAR|nr:hypothetical protein GGX14DRAFT_660571 [Mycena pura]
MFDDYDDYDEDYTTYTQRQDRYHNEESPRRQQPSPSRGSARQHQPTVEPQEKELPESAYHDGKGIEYVVAFVPLLPPLTTGEKRRANAKAPTEKVTIHAHEKLTFAELLDTAIAAIARPLPFKMVAEKLRTRHFTITWSLFRTAAYKNMQLNSEDHYKSMLTAASSKPAPVITLDMKELETEPAPAPDPNDISEKPSKRRKLSDEEEEIAELVIQIQQANRCADRACTSTYCFIGNASARHVRLTPMLLNLWAAAIVAKKPDVTITTPPPPEDAKAFWPLGQQNDDVDDIAMLAARRRNASHKPSSSVTINNDFAGLVTLLQPFLAPTGQEARPSTPGPRSTQPFPIASPAKPARMTIAEFCTAFKLSDALLQRLLPLEFDGPHVLAFVENEILDQYSQSCHNP